MKKAQRRQAIIYGTTVTFQSRSTRIAGVRWHTRWKDIYLTERDAYVAKSIYEKKGIIIFPNDLAKTKQVDPATLPLFSLPMRTESPTYAI